jgi:Gas vesicle protein G
VGLIKELVLLPVAPVRGVLWVSEQIAAEAERKQYAPGAAVQQLEQVEEQRERGELDEEEAKEIEEQVIEQQLTRQEGTEGG